MPWLPPFTVYNVNIGPRPPLRLASLAIHTVAGLYSAPGWPAAAELSQRLAVFPGGPAVRRRALGGAKGGQEAAHERGVPISDSCDIVKPEDTALANQASLCNVQPLLHTLSS